MTDYELIDSGDFGRLERFGSIVLNRPAPQAEWTRKLEDSIWDKADLYYQRDESRLEDSQWINSSGAANEWRIQIEHVCAQLALSQNGQIGIFPEQQSNWLWLEQTIKQANRPLHILNGFAHTGLATLFAVKAAPSIHVCHVDGAASAIKRAKINAQLNLSPPDCIRWIVDDMNKFLKREIRRGQRYDGIILDPPAFGRGKGFTWKFERDFPQLLDCIHHLLSDRPAFVLISCHAPDLTAQELLSHCQTIPSLHHARAETLDLIIPSTEGNPLPSGICARFQFP